MRISVIIPTYNKWHLTNRRLIQLLTHCTEDVYEVVLIDDESTEKFEKLDFWKANSPWKLLFDRNYKNEGFGFSMNSGAGRATGDAFVFLSNDVEFHSNFIAEIKEILEHDPNTLVGGELLAYDTGWNVINGIMIPYLNGWLLACTRNVWNILGGFDWITFGVSDYEDIDLSVNATYNGIKLTALAQHKLRHLAAQSFGYTDERRERAIQNKKKFEVKWASRLGEIYG